MKKNRRRWSAAEKRRLAGETRQRRAEGQKFAQICADLDVCEGSLRLWMQQFPEPAFREVAVSSEPAAKRTAGICVTMPDGVRVEGLDIDDLIVLLEVRA